METWIKFMTDHELMFLGGFLYVSHFAFITYLVAIKKQDFWYAVVGPDKRLDPLDLVKLFWLILFPIVVLADLFLDFTPEGRFATLENFAWGSLDAILFGVILRDVASEYLRQKENVDKNDTSTRET